MISQTPTCDTGMDGLYDGLYGAENQLKSSSSSNGVSLSKETRVLLSENYSLARLTSYPGLHRPARLDWHRIGQPLEKDLSNDVWLKTRHALAASDDSDEETTELLKKQRATPQNTPSRLETGYNEVLKSFNSSPVQTPTLLPTTPTSSPEAFKIAYTISESPNSSPTPTYCTAPSPSGQFGTRTATPILSPLPNPLQDSTIAARKQSQQQYTYIVLHDAVPLAAESLATTTVTGVYTTLEEANGFVERIAEETCRNVPEEHLRLLVEEDGEYGFDILDMERHTLHRVHIEKQVVRGAWSEKAEIEKIGVMRSQAVDTEIFDELAKLSL
ncbi:hypothetical protein NHQ30_008638 [Ciborinia camelliae]|nr:hypothetical protein NHQ30_008638 [Ciborinia camelliae]